MPFRRKNENMQGRVGLDIGTHTICGVEVIERGPDTVIRAAGSVQIPGPKHRQHKTEPGAIIQALKNLWTSAGFQSRKVVLALPNDAVYLKWLHLEAADEQQLTETARAAATRGAPFPADDAVVDFRILSSRGNLAKNVHFVMLVAASGSVIDQLLTITESAGLEPQAVDVGAVAALRSFESQKRTASPLWSGQPRAHFIVGANSTVITVIRGESLEFARTVPIGGNDFTECIAAQTGMSWTEAEKIKMTPGTRLIEGSVLVTSYNGDELRIACDSAAGRLAREALRSLKFFRSQFAEGSYLGMIGAATLSGGGALLKGLDSCLQEQGLDVTGIINPFAGYSVAAEGDIQQVSNSAAAYTTAMGLALGDYWSSRAADRDEESRAA